MHVPEPRAVRDIPALMTLKNTDWFAKCAVGKYRHDYFLAVLSRAVLDRH